MRVEIWSDISCPWCYVGEARFEKALAAFPHRDQVEVVHRSYELDPGRRKGENEPIVELLQSRYGWSKARALANEQNLTQLSAAEGLPYVQDRDHGNTFDMHRLLHLAKEHGLQEALLRRFYRANFGEQRSVFEGDERLVELAVEVGLDPDAVRAVLADPKAHADQVRADEREATQLGVSSVPFFVFDRTQGVAGAQSVGAFTQALEKAWAARPALQMVTAGAGDDACGPDGCPVPHLH